MTVPTLVQILQARGIMLWLDGAQIRGRVLQGHLTPSDRALLTAHRTALLTWLRQQKAGEGPAEPGTILPEPPCPRTSPPLCVLTVRWPTAAMPDVSSGVVCGLCVWEYPVARARRG